VTQLSGTTSVTVCSPAGNASEKSRWPEWWRRP
jgi:hypothetical protein